MKDADKIVKASKGLKAYFYAVLKVLPPYAKIMALASVATLICAVYPTVPDLGYVAYSFNSLQEIDGKIVYSMNPQWGEKDEVPDYYVNLSRKPKVGDHVIQLKPQKGDGTVYLCYHEYGHYYDEWVESLYASEKARKRRKMYLSFLMSASICLFAYPDLVRRMAKLVPGQERY